MTMTNAEVNAHRARYGYASNQEIAAKHERDAEEHHQAEAAALVGRERITDEATAIVTRGKVPAAGILAGVERGDSLATLFYREHETALVETERALADAETAQREAAANGPLTLLQSLEHAQRIEPLRAKLPRVRALRDACREAAIRYVRETLEPVIAEQVRQRDDLLRKAIPIEDRIRDLERVRRALGVRSSSSRVLGVARWIRE